MSDDLFPDDYTIGGIDHIIECQRCMENNGFIDEHNPHLMLSQRMFIDSTNADGMGF